MKFSILPADTIEQYDLQSGARQVWVLLLLLLLFVNMISYLHLIRNLFLLQAIYEADVTTELFLHTYLRKFKQETSTLISSPDQDPETNITLVETNSAQSSNKPGRQLALGVKYKVAICDVSES